MELRCAATYDCVFPLRFAERLSRRLHLFFRQHVAQQRHDGEGRGAGHEGQLLLQGGGATGKDGGDGLAQRLRAVEAPRRLHLRQWSRTQRRDVRRERRVRATGNDAQPLRRVAQEAEQGVGKGAQRAGQCAQHSLLWLCPRRRIVVTAEGARQHGCEQQQRGHGRDDASSAGAQESCAVAVSPLLLLLALAVLLRQCRRAHRAEYPRPTWDPSRRPGAGGTTPGRAFDALAVAGLATVAAAAAGTGRTELVQHVVLLLLLRAVVRVEHGVVAERVWQVSDGDGAVRQFAQSGGWQRHSGSGAG